MIDRYIKKRERESVRERLIILIEIIFSRL